MLRLCSLIRMQKKAAGLRGHPDGRRSIFSVGSHPLPGSHQRQLALLFVGFLTFFSFFPLPPSAQRRTFAYHQRFIVASRAAFELAASSGGKLKL